MAGLLQHVCEAEHSNIRLGIFVSSIFAGAFAFGVSFDVGVQSFWDNWNKGVSQNCLDCVACADELPNTSGNGRTYVPTISKATTHDGYILDV
ncbi:subunit 9 of the ubiquinol cytochrome-c reductase complex, QCR9 [Chiua virens]|nr:subunit 9 of the ubiquinol cytochrome-c reductase complex, QCR9 [Chiua virens]